MEEGCDFEATGMKDWLQSIKNQTDETGVGEKGSNLHNRLSNDYFLVTFSHEDDKYGAIMDGP